MRMDKNHFRVTEDHIKLIQNFYVRWEDSENGAPSIDCKRPYGNSHVASDVCEILGWDMPEDYESYAYNDICEQAEAVHKETEIALQILLCNLSISPGLYYKPEKNVSRNWKRVEE